MKKDNTMIIMSYEQFKEKLNASVTIEDSFYYDLLVNILKSPNRYIGLFRTTDIKVKLFEMLFIIKKLKFDDFMKEITAEYIEKIGYTNISEDVFQRNKEDTFSVSKVFQKDNIIYFIEQKIRDVYSSYEKNKVFEDFKKKYLILKQQFPDKEINAILWFIDDNFRKNKKCFSTMSSNERQLGFNINVLYGCNLFLEVFHRMDVWDEIYEYFSKSRQERNNELLTIQDFNTSDRISEALKQLSVNEPQLYKKLLFNEAENIEM